MRSHYIKVRVSNIRGTALTTTTGTKKVIVT